MGVGRSVTLPPPAPSHQVFTVAWLSPSGPNLLLPVSHATGHCNDFSPSYAVSAIRIRRCWPW